jgi:macrodomain Ter protein organizer (MatP/YcbG family)
MQPINLIDASTGRVRRRIQLSDALWKQIQRYSKKHGTTPSDVILQAAREKLACSTRAR